MASVNIRLKEINDVYKLVNVLVGFDGDVDLESGRYKVDGKSILGIFSLDLRNPIKLTYSCQRGRQREQRVRERECRRRGSRWSAPSRPRSRRSAARNGSPW